MMTFILDCVAEHMEALSKGQYIGFERIQEMEADYNRMLEKEIDRRINLQNNLNK